MKTATILTRWLVTMGRGLFHKMYLNRYFVLRPNNPGTTRRLAISHCGCPFERWRC